MFSMLISIARCGSQRTATPGPSVQPRTQEHPLASGIYYAYLLSWGHEGPTAHSTRAGPSPLWRLHAFDAQLALSRAIPRTVTAQAPFPRGVFVPTRGLRFLLVSPFSFFLFFFFSRHDSHGSSRGDHSLASPAKRSCRWRGRDDGMPCGAPGARVARAVMRSSPATARCAAPGLSRGRSRRGSCSHITLPQRA